MKREMGQTAAKEKETQLAGKSSQLGREKNEMEVKMVETKLLTAKELAQKAEVSPQVLRKMLRKDFNRAGKALVEGNRSEYRFDPNDIVTKDIIAKAKELKANKGEQK